MIDRAQQHAACIRWQTSQRRVNRTKLAFFPFVIDDDFSGRERNPFFDGLGVRAEHYAAHSDRGMIGYREQVLQNGRP